MTQIQTCKLALHWVNLSPGSDWGKKTEGGIPWAAGSNLKCHRCDQPSLKVIICRHLWPEIATKCDHMIPEADRDEEVLPSADVAPDLVLDGLLRGVHGVLAAPVDPLQRLLHQVQGDPEGVPEKRVEADFRNCEFFMT